MSDRSSLTYTGDITSESGLDFQGKLDLTGLAPVDQIPLLSSVGTYNASYTFADASVLSMQGQLETQISIYTVNAGSSTIMVDLQTNSLTDMTTTLNLNLDQAGAVTSGDLSSQGVNTGTVDDAGIISYTDGTLEALPAPII